MAERALNVGDRLVAISQNGMTEMGDVVTVTEVFHRWPNHNFKCKEVPDYTFPHQAFRHLRDKSGVDELEGWINDETYHAALVMFNDSTTVRHMDRYIDNGSVPAIAVETRRMDGLMPDGLNGYANRKNIDFFSIYWQRITERYEQDNLSTDRYNNWKKRITRDNGLNRRRMRILKVMGFITADPFFDHYGAMKNKAAQLPVRLEPPEPANVLSYGDFKVGDRVRYYQLCGSHDGGVAKGTILQFVTGDLGVRAEVAFDHYGVQQYYPRDLLLLTPDELAEEVSQHIANADEIINQVEAATTKEQIIMKVETKHYVNGQDVSSYTVEQQADLIANTEARIEKLKAIKTPTKAISGEIKKLEEFIKSAVEQFDKAAE